MTGAEWSRTGGCPDWTGTDLAGHLVTTMQVWDQFLTRGLAGDGSVEFPWDDFDRVNSELLRDLPIGTGPERVAAFAEASESFYQRLAEADADLVIGTPAATHFGRDVSMADFASYAGIEWHLHAHDLAVSAGEDYVPSDMPAVRRALEIWFNRPVVVDMPWSVIVANRPGQ